MNSPSILPKNLAEVISKNSPIILTSLAVGGLVSTSILAVRATPKAIELISREECNVDRELTKWETVRITWKCYIPAAGMAIASIFCIVSANSINMRRNAALASIYTITDQAFREYQSKVIETFGKNKELGVRDQISADRIKTNPSGANEVIFTGKGTILCYDSLTGRYFKSSIEHIKQSINELNRQLLNDMFITLNELYEELGLSGTKLGDLMGWDVNRSLIEATFSTQLSEEGEPCLVLNFDVFPRFI